MRAPAALCLATALALSVLPAAAETFTEAQIKALALQAIRDNPDIVMEAAAAVQAREAEAADAAAQASLGSMRDQLERDPNAPVIGNPDGDVTVVEFFDYNCPYCRKASAEVAQVIAADDAVRVVFREWPILGDGSVFATKAALAARAQDKYVEMHEALMGAKGRLDEASTMKIAEEVDLDLDRLRVDMEAPEVQAHIDTTMQLAQSLGFTGTPSFVIGDARAPGLIDAEQMQIAIEAARDGG